MTDRKSMYIETTIPSYATGRMSTDIVIAGRQILTKLFWENERQKYDLYISHIAFTKEVNDDLLS